MEPRVIINDKEMRDALEQLQVKIGNPAPALRQIGVFYERSVLENFKAQAAPDGTPWARLSQTTMMMNLSQKGRIGKKGGLTTRGRKYIQGKRILWEHGDLEGAVHHQVGKNSVIIGVGGHIKYAAIHQFGGKAGRGLRVNIPARPYLALNRGTEMELSVKDKMMILMILEGWLDK